ncbi:HET-domain-containing protein [Echria macrotheca]|uniref:HET-domain-containing protein n=1 Tax=Echria macrotheca TaxID=438768 RepID=A0AAJ0B0J8_9PEZI|nr:HET-domain-containing protein [Echria macrotheca]
MSSSTSRFSFSRLLQRNSRQKKAADSPSQPALLDAIPFRTVTTIPHQLCKVCRKFAKSYQAFRLSRGLALTEFKDGDYAQFRHQTSLRALVKSSLRGCHLCSLIAAAVAHRMEVAVSQQTAQKRTANQFPQLRSIFPFSGPLDEPPPAWPYRITLSVATWHLISYGSMHQLSIHLPVKIPNMVTPDLEIHASPAEEGRDSTCHDAPEPAGQDLTARFVCSTASEACFRLARSWLADCTSNHPRCTKGLHRSPQNYLPTRLLDTNPDERDPTRLRLCLGCDLEPSEPYLTLSHCWGTTPTKKLTSDNIEALKGGFRFEELPLTFQHAVLIARELGVRYLWIDSLCIIQNSISDWEVESATMGRVYSHSLCTISALHSSSSESGCFASRDPQTARPCRILGDETAGLYVHNYSPEMAEWRFSGDDATTGHLHKRAWVVQERLLSPRTLHYGSREISWECVTGDKSEAWPRGIQWDWKDNELYRRPKEMFSSILEFNDKSKLGSYHGAPVGPGDLETSELQDDGAEKFTAPTYIFQKTYGSIIQMYTSCSLTFAKDKLTAISGIIQLIEQSSGLTPIAGLWRELLLPNMLWFSQTSSPRPEFNSGDKPPPSWSWASVSGPVEFVYPRLHVGGEESVLFLKMWVSYKLEWKAVVHEASPTLLHIRAPLRPIRWGENSGAEAYQYNHQARSGNDLWISDFPLNESTSNLHALLVAHGKTQANVESGRMDIGLILAPLDGDDQGKWTRVGLFQQNYWDRDKYPIFVYDAEPLEPSDVLIL